jgi:hypothetical protein
VTARDYYRRNAEYIKQRSRKWQKRIKVATVGPRTGKRWTAAEDAVILRTDLTNIQKAFILGRTYGAVVTRQLAAYMDDANMGEQEITSEGNDIHGVVPG